MKYLIVDDEYELYKIMYNDLFQTSKYDVTEIPQFIKMPKLLRLVKSIHLSDKINYRINTPFKGIWNPFYTLSHYNFEEKENYCILFLNGTLRTKFSFKYLKNLKEKHPNVKLAVIIYDSKSNPSSNRTYDMLDIFDFKFSFDEQDCLKYNLEHFPSTFSMPTFLEESVQRHSSAYFIGTASQRLSTLHRILPTISQQIPGCNFHLVGVKKKEQLYPQLIDYCASIPYCAVLQDVYNTDCIIDIVKAGQTGISLRCCEAILFNKKYVTNNIELYKFPFFDHRYMRVIQNELTSEDIQFIMDKIPVNYNYNGLFSPLRILERIEAIYKKGEV